MDFDFLHSPTSVLDFDESESSFSGASDTSTETDSESEDGITMDFEARSRDGVWYDVEEIVSFRELESGGQEALVRLGGLEEWVNVRNDLRERSIPCISPDCTIIYPGDLILCYKERIEDALYYDAHVLNAQRHRHDVRGCHCNFLVQYDHDQSREIVPLRKICRRPETDARLQHLSAASTSTSTSTSGSHQGSNVHSAGGSQQGSSNPLPPPPAGGSSGASS